MSMTIDSTDFADRTEPFRRELLAHCYRLLGSVDDAEDLVQETYLRAWRSYAGFEARSSLRTWLYQIATNACLTALRRRRRRPLPSGLGGPGGDPDAGPDMSWLQPVPDMLVFARPDDPADPAAVAVSRESVRLALIASLQLLPPRQRAVLLLCEVLAFPAAEVAGMLGATTTAVKSALQRARATIGQAAPDAGQIAAPSGAAARAVLERYIAAFENADAGALKELLLEEATLEMPPAATWFAGCDAIATAISGLGSPGDWRMIPTWANGQPAAAAYERGTDGCYRAYGIVVLTVADDHIAGIVVFGDIALFPVFGLPIALPTALWAAGQEAGSQPATLSTSAATSAGGRP